MSKSYVSAHQRLNKNETEFCVVLKFHKLWQSSGGTSAKGLYFCLLGNAGNWKFLRGVGIRSFLQRCWRRSDGVRGAPMINRLYSQAAFLEAICWLFLRARSSQREVQNARFFFVANSVSNDLRFTAVYGASS